MPRSIGILRVQDWDVIPYPIDYRTINNNTLVDPSRSSIDNFVNMNLHEESGPVLCHITY